MGRFGWNLPPGCSVSDIPGNRPQDARSEAFWDELHERFPWLTDLDEDRRSSVTYERVEELVAFVFEAGVLEGEMRAKDAEADRQMAEAAAKGDYL